MEAPQTASEASEAARVAPEPAGVAQSVALSPNVGHRSCSDGCIAGIVIGSIIAGVIVLLLGFLLLIWCRRRLRGGQSRSASVSGSQVDLLDRENPSMSSERFFELYQQRFSPGDKVFCKVESTCAPGQVVEKLADNVYKVSSIDGSMRTVQNKHMAPQFSSDASVFYQPPSGGDSISCTVLHADGSYWPPFYQIRPDDSSLDSINTTAEHLMSSSKQISEVCSSDIVAHAA